MDKRAILIRVTAKDADIAEGGDYKDICDELMLEDFLSCPFGFAVELLSEKEPANETA